MGIKLLKQTLEDFDETPNDLNEENNYLKQENERLSSALSEIYKKKAEQHQHNDAEQLQFIIGAAKTINPETAVAIAAISKMETIAEVHEYCEKIMEGVE